MCLDGADQKQTLQGIATHVMANWPLKGHGSGKLCLAYPSCLWLIVKSLSIRKACSLKLHKWQLACYRYIEVINVSWCIIYSLLPQWSPHIESPDCGCCQVTKQILTQGRSKLFTTGQAKLNSVHYVIKCVGARYNWHCPYGFYTYCSMLF